MEERTLEGDIRIFANKQDRRQKKELFKILAYHNPAEPHEELINSLNQSDKEFVGYANKNGYDAKFFFQNNKKLGVVTLYHIDCCEQSENFFGPLAIAAAKNFINTKRI